MNQDNSDMHNINISNQSYDDEQEKGQSIGALNNVQVQIQGPQDEYNDAYS